jgi:hypothetical protein
LLEELLKKQQEIFTPPSLKIRWKYLFSAPCKQNRACRAFCLRITLFFAAAQAKQSLPQRLGTNKASLSYFSLIVATSKRFRYSANQGRAVLRRRFAKFSRRQGKLVCVAFNSAAHRNRPLF